MKHFFMEIDGMTVTYGDIVKGRLCDTVPYCVERDNGEGDFDFAQGSLPTCTPVKSKGFAESELWDIESLMRDNMHNIYDQIRGEDYLLQAYPQVPVLAVIPELLQRTEGYGYGYGDEGEETKKKGFFRSKKKKD